MFDAFWKDILSKNNTEIINLSAKALQLFILTRIKEQGKTEIWKKELKKTVDKEIQGKHKDNYMSIHKNFDKGEQNFTLDSLDTSSLYTIIKYYLEKDGIYSKKDDESKDKNDYLLKDHAESIKDARNTLAHTRQPIPDSEALNWYYDQLFYANCIANFAVLNMKHQTSCDEWKQIYFIAKDIESTLRSEHWLAMDSIHNSEIGVTEDLSEITHLAEQGQVDFQVKLAKAYYYGHRVKRDEGKAFYWFYKAANGLNIEASYYLGMFYYRGGIAGNDNIKAQFWLKRSAEKGFAAAQYEYGMILYREGFYGNEEQSKIECFKWIELSAKQNYPKAVKMLSDFYSCGFSTNADQEKAQKLLVKAAELGDVSTCIGFAKEEKKKGNYDLALHWCDMAKTQDVDMIKEIEETKKRIMRKKNDENKH